MGLKQDMLELQAIHIQNSSGKLYEFNTQGNIVQSFEINGKIYNYGE